MLFLLSFLGLTLVYVIVFVLIDAIHLVVRGVLGKSPRMGFKEAVVAAAGSLFDKAEDDPDVVFPEAAAPTEKANKANNKRWYYLVAMTIVTGFIAAANPGDPVLVSSLKELPKEVFSQETRDKAATGRSTFLHGPTKAKEMAEAAKTEEAKKAAAKRWWKFGSSELNSATGWPWHAFFLIYLAGIIPYGIVAFWDELVVASKAAYAKFEEHRARIAAEPSKSGGSKGEHHVGILDIISWSVIMDVVVEFATKFMAHRAAKGSE